MSDDDRAKKMRRDWSQLPGELVDPIMRRLAKLADVIRFQAVCKPWKHAVLDQEQNPPKFRQSLPWQLKYCYHGSGCHRFVDVMAADNNNRNSDRHVHLPRNRRDLIFPGSAFGWMIVQKFRGRGEALTVVYLWNPLTGNKINLPKKTGRGPRSYVRGFAMSAEPTAASGCVVVVIYHGILEFCKLAKDRIWTSIPFREDLNLYSIGNLGLGFWRDKILVADSNGKVLAWDLVVTGPDDEADDNQAQLPSWAFVPGDFPAGRYIYCNTVVSPEGELVLVSVRLRVADDDGLWRAPGISCRVYKLNEGGKRRWDEVETIGDYALFVDNNGVIYVSTRDHPEVRRNCVYYGDYILDLNEKEFGVVTNNSDYLTSIWILPSNY